MINYTIIAVYFGCTVLCLINGSWDSAGRAVMDGAAQAVSFTLSVAGGICLWSAVLELMERSGLSGALARRLRPLLGRLFPLASRDETTLRALAENVSANLLGLGNAATPAGVRAARGIAALGRGRAVSDELCLLVVLNTASIQLLPTTIASVRAALGACSPFDIIPAVWLSSLLSVSAGLLAGTLLRRIWH